MGRMPDFIVVGSMKSGTTTLHEELNRHPDVYMSSWKEPGYFVGPDFGGPEKAPLPLARKSEYTRLFEGALENQLCGESSTYYTKMPDFNYAAKNIFSQLGKNVKFIFVVREPVSRAISHYGHAYQHKECTAASFSKALKEYPQLIDYSRYSMQISQYRELFSPENILVIKFENFISDKSKYVNLCINFLGLDCSTLPHVDEGASRNSAADRREWYGWARRLRWSPFFQTRIEPVFSKRFLTFLKRVVTRDPQKIAYGDDLERSKEVILSALSDEDVAVYNDAL